MGGACEGVDCWAGSVAVVVWRKLAGEVKTEQVGAMVHCRGGSKKKTAQERAEEKARGEGEDSVQQKSARGI